MKLTKLSLAVLTAAIIPAVANASVTVTPALLGYYNTEDSQDKHAGTYTKSTKSKGFTIDSDLYASAAVGVELNPATQLQVEYGAVNADAENKDGSVRHDAQMRNIAANLLVGTEHLTGHSTNKLKPYVLVGVGESTTKINDGETGENLMRHKDTIGNVGLGARYKVNDMLALRGEARGTYNFENKWWDTAALAGLEVSLGKRTDKRVEVPVFEPETIKEDVEFFPILPAQLDGDKDGDGIPDSQDACPGTPSNLSVDARGCPKQMQVQENLQLELRVFFDKDKSEIKPQFRQEVAKVASAMQEFPNASAVIEGHASKDSARSNSRYNQRLSEARAAAVRSMLVNEFGVAPNRLNAVGYGFDKPITTNDTEEGRSMNRRVIAVIQGDRIQTIEQQK